MPLFGNSKGSKTTDTHQKQNSPAIGNYTTDVLDIKYKLKTMVPRLKSLV